MKKVLKIFRNAVLVTVVLIVLVVLFFGYRDIPIETLKQKYAKEPSAFIRVGNMNVHYRDEGPKDAIPLVLIHGTGSSLHTFDAWTNELKRNYRVVRMDLPAYGLTGPFPHGDYSTEQYVDFIYSFINELGINTCVLGGNSLGGRIAWSFTLKYPDLVEKLVLIDASGYPTLAKSKPLAFKLAEIPIIKNAFTYITPRFIAEGSVKNVYADKSKVSQDLVDRYFELTLREGNRQAFVDKLAAKNNVKAYKAIPAITQPTLIIWGDKDELIPVENAYKFQNSLPNDTLVVLQNVGHVPMEESPMRSLEPLLSFLNNN